MVQSENRSETGLFAITYPAQFVLGLRHSRHEEPMQGLQTRFQPQL